MLKPLKFWKSLKTKLAGCLWSLHASIVIMTTTNDRIFQMIAALDILSSKCGPYILTAVLIKAIR